MSNLKNPKAIINVYRMRYQRDPLTRKSPSYTEYQLVVDGVNIFTRRPTDGYSNVKKFKQWCLQTKKCKELGVIEIDIAKPFHIQLDFQAQR